MNPDRPDIRIVSSADFPRAGEALDVRCEVSGAGGGYSVDWTRVGGELPGGAITRGDMIRSVVRRVTSYHSSLSPGSRPCPERTRACTGAV